MRFKTLKLILFICFITFPIHFQAKLPLYAFLWTRNPYKSWCCLLWCAHLLLLATAATVFMKIALIIVKHRFKPNQLRQQLDKNFLHKQWVGDAELVAKCSAWQKNNNVKAVIIIIKLINRLRLLNGLHSAFFLWSVIFIFFFIFLYVHYIITSATLYLITTSILLASFRTPNAVNAVMVGGH